MATQFDDYFFGGGLESAARKAVAEAVEQARAAGLPIEGHASSPPAPAIDQAENAVESDKDSKKKRTP